MAPLFMVTSRSAIAPAPLHLLAAPLGATQIRALTLDPFCAFLRPSPPNLCGHLPVPPKPAASLG